MNKEARILKIMKDDGCSWEEAERRERERKSLSEFF